MRLTPPPGVMLLAGGYGAGLVTGLSHLRALPLVAAILVIAALLLGGKAWASLFPAYVLGTAAGVDAQHESRRRCAAVLALGEHRYRVHAVDPGAGSGRVTLDGSACVGAVVARWPRNIIVPAGQSATVSARWEPAQRAFARPDGMLMIRSVDATGNSPSVAEQLRNGIANSSAALYGPRAPLVNALVAGWRGELDPELRSGFASAGLMHLLAISGFHIAWLAGWVLLLLRLAGAPRHPAEFIAAGVALAYAWFIGWPAAAARASLLLCLAAFCRWRQRQVQWGALLGASVLVMMLLDPWAVGDPGAWLSVAGLWGVVAALRWSERTLGSSWFVSTISTSSGAVIATAPVTAAVFGQVAPIGIILNLIGMPLLLVILPTIFAPLLLHRIVPPVATALAATGNGSLALLETLVRFGARAPGSAETGAIGWQAAWPWLLVLLAARWITWRRTTLPEAGRRVAWCAVGALAGTLLLGSGHSIATSEHGLTLVFADVGQGDAALIRTPDGHWIEVDAGPAGDGRDAGKRVIAPMLAAAGVPRLDLFVVSHAHRDHVGGGAAVLARIPILVALEPGELFADSAYEGWLDALAERHVRWRPTRAGSDWSIDGVRFRVVHPPRVWSRQGEDLNEDSIVLEVTFGAFRALLTGDAGFVAESAMAGALSPVNVLKVGHHGSKTASSEAFLAAVRPQVAVVSVGRNTYGHPAPETLDRIENAGAAVWRTDIEGTITVRTDGRTFTVNGVRSSATFGTTH